MGSAAPRPAKWSGKKCPGSFLHHHFHSHAVGEVGVTEERNFIALLQPLQDFKAGGAEDAHLDLLLAYGAGLHAEGATLHQENETVRALGAHRAPRNHQSSLPFTHADAHIDVGIG